MRVLFDPFMHLPQPESVFRKYLGLSDSDPLPPYIDPSHLSEEPTKGTP